MEKEISITQVGNIRIGQVEDTKAATGCTVIIPKDIVGTEKKQATSTPVLTAVRSMHKAMVSAPKP